MTAQLGSSQRSADGMGAAAVGVAFLLRAVGDAAREVRAGTVAVVSAWPPWLSPIGWGQPVRAFGGERWDVPALFVVLAVGAVAVAVGLTNRRDVGVGIVRPHPGPAVASRWLTSPAVLAFRLQRGAWIGWAAGLMVVAAAFGLGCGRWSSAS